MSELTDAVAVITGGGQGLGRAIALAYASEGAKVVLASRSKERLEETERAIKGLGAEALVIPTDVLDETSVNRLAETTLEHFGRIDVLVANSGIAGPTTPLWNVTLNQWKETIDTNLTGVFLCCKACLPSMIERRHGSIVLISSGTGKNPLIGRTPYAASKIALVGLARTLAMEAGSYQVRVNVISPGPLDGERIQQVIRKQAELRNISYEAARESATRGSALGRFVTAEEVARTAVFLASEKSSAITGEDINVSAGLVMI